MGIGPHGSLTVVPLGRHRRVAVAGPGVMPGLGGEQRPGPAQRVAAGTTRVTGKIFPYGEFPIKAHLDTATGARSGYEKLALGASSPIA